MHRLRLASPVSHELDRPWLSYAFYGYTAPGATEEFWIQIEP
jgi:hypothetical protein